MVGLCENVGNARRDLNEFKKKQTKKTIPICFSSSQVMKEIGGHLLGANNVCYNISVHVTSFIHGGRG